MTRVDKATGPLLIGHEFRFFGGRFRILESARETDDGSLRGEYFAPPRGNVPEHIHPAQEERFEVVSGTLGVRVGGREPILSPGQSAVGLPSVLHKWWSPSAKEICFLVGLRPGLGVETVLETLLGLARDGKTTRTGIPRNRLQLAVLAREAGSWGHVTGVLGPVQKTFFALLAPAAFVGKMFLYRASYPEYSGPEQTTEPTEPKEKPYRPEGLLPLVSVLWLLN